MSGKFMWRVLVFILIFLFPVNLYAEHPVSFILVIDESGSMKYPGHDPEGRRIDAAANFTYFMDEEDYVSIIGFGDRSRIILPLTKVDANRDYIINRLSDVRSDQKYTMINSGLETALNIASTSKTKDKVVIIFTDGQFIPHKDFPPNVNYEEYINNTFRICKTFADKGIPIYAIAFTKEANVDLLAKLSSLTNGKFYRARVPLDIGKIYTDIMSILPKGYSIPYIASGRIVKKDVKISSSAVIEFRVTAYKRRSSAPLPKIEIYNPKGNLVKGERFTTKTSITVSIKNPMVGIWHVKAYGVNEPIDVELVKREKIEIEVIEPPIGRLSRAKGSNLPIKLRILPGSPDYKVQVTVKTPSNRKINIKMTFNGSEWEGEARQLTETGNYSLLIKVITPSGSVFKRNFDFYVSAIDPFRFRVFNTPVVGDPIRLILKRIDSKAIIKDIKVIIDLPPKGKANELTLYDDGNLKHGDETKGDGVFSNIFKPKFCGRYRIFYKVSYYYDNTALQYQRDTIISKYITIHNYPLRVSKNKWGRLVDSIYVKNCSSNRFAVSLNSVMPPSFNARFEPSQITLLPNTEKKVKILLYASTPKMKINKIFIKLQIRDSENNAYTVETPVSIQIINPMFKIIKLIIVLLVISMILYLVYNFFVHHKLSKIAVDVEVSGKSVRVYLKNLIGFFDHKIPIEDISEVSKIIIERNHSNATLGVFGYNIFKGWYIHLSRNFRISLKIEGGEEILKEKEEELSRSVDMPFVVSVNGLRFKFEKIDGGR